jgi:hypothetical protein
LGDGVDRGSFHLVLTLYLLLEMSAVICFLALIKFELNLNTLVWWLLKAELAKRWVRRLNRNLAVRVVLSLDGYFELIVYIAG